MYFGDARRPTDAAIQALPHGFWSSFGLHHSRQNGGTAQFLLTVTLASNFGTFLLYMLSCVTCIVCLPRPSQVQLRPPPVYSDLWIAGQPGLHGLLLGRPIHGVRHQEGAACSPWESHWCGPSMEESTSCAPARPRGALRWSSARRSRRLTRNPLSDVTHEGGFRPALYLV